MIQRAGFAIPEAEIRRQASADVITYLSTGIAVVHNGSMLVVRRAPYDYLGGMYELPGGGVDDGETLLASLARELREETGLQLDRVLGMFPGFEYTTPNKPKVCQLNFLVSVSDNNVQLSSEHDAYTWLSSKSDIDQLALTGPMKTCIQDAFELAASFA